MSILISIFVSIFVVLKMFVFMIAAFFICLELLNMYKFNKFLHCMSKKSKCNHNPFERINADKLNEYSQFMRCNLLIDNFFDIFCSYYRDKIITHARIEKVIEKYVFDKTKLHSTIQLDVIPLHKTVNKLSKIFANRYILFNFDNVTQHMHDWLDLSTLPVYNSALNVMRSFVK